jgi:hypothetical protein
MTPRDKVIAVEGADLRARLGAARRAARAAGAARYWAAYQFPSRPDVAVEATFIGPRGERAQLAGAVTGNVGPYETRHLGVFLLLDAGGPEGAAPARAEVYNLELRHDFERRPVYWLGLAGADESVSLLGDLLGTEPCEGVGGTLVEALALHDEGGGRPPALLERLARGARGASVRATAVKWLGRTPGHLELLTAVVGDARESLDVRGQAARSLGKNPDPGGAAALGRLYALVGDPRLRWHIIEGLSKSREKPAALTLLRGIAEREADAALRARALTLIDKVEGKKKKKAGGGKDYRAEGAC